MVKLPFGISIGRSPSPAATPSAGPFDPARGEAEVGSPGTVYYSGFLDSEEYNKDLQGEKAILTFTRMRADSQVEAMLRSLTLPFRGAKPHFEPFDDSDQAKLVAEVCEALLLKLKGQKWDDLIREAFTGTLQYGHSVFESVWGRPVKGTTGNATAEVRYEPNLVDFDGKTYLAPYKLAVRMQKTIYRWLIDSAGDLMGIQQRTWVGTVKPGTDVPTGERPPPLPSGAFKFITIPVDRLFVFVLDREGANFAGRSVLRAAYKNWYYKDNLLRIGALAAERQGVGVPYAIAKQGIGTSETNALVGALRALHAHEKSYLLVNESSLADGGKLGMAPLGIMDMRASGTRTVEGQVQYHDRQMVISILADFLTLGSGTGGNANVMHRDKASLFYQSLTAVKRPFEDAFTDAVIAPFVRLNFGEDAPIPVFTLSGLEARDLVTRAQGLATLFGAGALTPTPETEQQLREELDLPGLEEEDGTPIYPEFTPPGKPGKTRPGDPEPQPFPFGGPPKLGPDGKPLPPELGPDGKPLPGSDDPKLDPEARRMVALLLDILEGRDVSPPKPRRVPRRLADDQQAALLKRAQRRQEVAAEEIQERLDRLLDTEDGYTSAEFARDSAGILAAGSVAMWGLGFLAGRPRPRPGRPTPQLGPGTPAEAQQRAYRASILAERLPFMQDLATKAESGEIARDQVAIRAAMAAGVIWSSAFRGQAAAKGGSFRARWDTADTEACPLCDPRDGVEYTETDLPGYPGEGSFGDLCDGGPNCRCELVFLEDEEDGGDTSSLTLAEGHCPSCTKRGRRTAKLIGRDVNPEAWLWCPYCKTEVQPV